MPTKQLFLQPGNFRADDAGLAFIAEREGIRNDAYVDPGSGGEPITIGIGHTNPGVIKLGMRWSNEKVMQVFKDEDVPVYEDVINRLVKVPLTQGMVNALVDFVFNEGETNFRGSTLLRLLNVGDYDGADHQFCRWNIASGHVLGGLTTRRALESDMFETPAEHAAKEGR